MTGRILPLVASLLTTIGVGTAACSSQGPKPETVGSSVNAISATSIVTATGTATSPYNASSAAGDATDVDVTKTDELTVFQGTVGTAAQNGFTQRWRGGTSMTTVTNPNSTWVTGTLTLADSASFHSFSGPIKVAYLNEPNKFVIASTASSSNANGTNVDVVLERFSLAWNAVPTVGEPAT
jgi:hypothetical protein